MVRMAAVVPPVVCGKDSSAPRSKGRSDVIFVIALLQERLVQIHCTDTALHEY